MGPECHREDPLAQLTLLDSTIALSLSDIELEELEDAAPRPSQVRTAVLAQHDKIRGLLRMLDRKATHLMASPVPSASDREGTRQLAMVLCLVLTSHIEFENRVLTAALETLDAWGPLRAERLRAEHAEQLQLLNAYADALEQNAGSGAELALEAWRLVGFIREDMQHEEATMLNAKLFSDELIASDVETG